MVLLTHHGLRAEDVVNELGAPSRFIGLKEKALSQRVLNFILRSDLIPVFLCRPFDETAAPVLAKLVAPFSDDLGVHYGQLFFFCKIAAKDIPAQTVRRRRDVVLKDIRPAALVHLLLIPKVHFDSWHTPGTQLWANDVESSQIAEAVADRRLHNPDNHKQRRRTGGHCISTSWVRCINQHLTIHFQL